MKGGGVASEGIVRIMTIGDPLFATRVRAQKKKKQTVHI